MAQVVWTLEAQLWLRDIFDYIAAENPEAAIRVVSELHAGARSPETTPDCIRLDDANTSR